MGRQTPAWHAEVHAMRAQGWTVMEIAREIGREQSMVRWVLNENNDRERARMRANKSRGYGYDYAGPRSVLTAHRPTSLPKPARPDRSTSIRAAAEAFARNEIDRAELSRRLRDA